MIYLQLFKMALVPVAGTVLFHILITRTSFGKFSYWKQQIVIGIVFGIFACMATQFGVRDAGFVINVRSAVPLTAGLIFGGPAGIISGIIGGIYRWVSVAWGIASYTRVACTAATVIAGLIGAICRKFMFDNKNATWFYGFFIGLATENIHMLLVFITHYGQLAKVLQIIKTVTVPMVLSNSLSVMMSLLVISCLSGNLKPSNRKKSSLIQTFSLALFFCITVAYLITLSITASMGNSISDKDTSTRLVSYLIDVEKDIRDTSDERLLSKTRDIAASTTVLRIADMISADSSEQVRDLNRASLEVLCQKYSVSEINIVDKNGIIIISTNKNYDLYDMRSEKGMNSQAERFLCLLSGYTQEYVQAYQSIDYDPNIYMKYAGVALDKGGFVQVGYGAVQNSAAVRELLNSIAVNRHICNTGYVAIYDSDNGEVMSISKDSVSEADAAYIYEQVKDQPENILIDFEASDGSGMLGFYGYTEGYLVLACQKTSEAIFANQIFVYTNMYLQIILFTILFALVYFLIKKSIIENVYKVNDSLTQITEGNLDVKVAVGGSYEFTSLSDDINSTVDRLKGYISEAENRMKADLELAREIQSSSLPSVFPPYPSRTDFDIYARMDTAKEVGGDFYDFYCINANQLIFLIADVSGKGIPAAMFMMRARTAIKGYAQLGLTAGDIFKEANNQLCNGNEAGMFLTAWMGILDTDTGEVQFVNAGHNRPVIKHPDGSCEFLTMKSGFVLAGMEGIPYKNQTLTLAPGDSIILYTDGITEAQTKAEELYGDDRLLEAIGEMDPASDTKEFCDNLKASVDNFVADAPQFDDMTILALTYKGH